MSELNNKTKVSIPLAVLGSLLVLVIGAGTTQAWTISTNVALMAADMASVKTDIGVLKVAVIDSNGGMQFLRERMAAMEVWKTSVDRTIDRLEAERSK